MQQQNKFKYQKLLLKVISGIILFGGSPLAFSDTCVSWIPGVDCMVRIPTDEDTDGAIQDVLNSDSLEEAVNNYSTLWMLRGDIVSYFIDHVGGQAVSIEEREQICLDTGGQFSQELNVSDCSDEIAVIDSQHGSVQNQQCVGGIGGNYENVCVYQDPQGQYYWDDGPSIPGGADALLGGLLLDFDTRYSILFWKAGQLHDYCYHHGAAEYGFTKGQCDNEFVIIMYDICQQKWDNWWEEFNQLECELAAGTMYKAVVELGSGAYAATNTMVDYRHLYDPPVMAPQVDEVLYSVVVSTTSILLL